MGDSSTVPASAASDQNHRRSSSTTPSTPTPATPIPDSVMEGPIAAPQLAGHLGYLTDEQTEAFDAFKELLVKEGLFTPAVLGEDGTTVVSAASHDDGTLLRFLRARSFQPPAAVTQFKRSEEWRKEIDLENLYANGLTPEELENTRLFYPRWTGRRDKNGLPVYVYPVADLQTRQKELEAVPPKQRYERIIVLYEMMIRFQLPMCSHLPHPTSPHPISATTTIIDLANASFTSLFRLRGHFQEASKLATPYYPETLGTMIIVNAPSFFSTVWGWIKGWFDEATRHKIHVLSKDDMATTLLSLIEAQDLPKVYGGELEWSFSGQPVFDDETLQVLPSGKMPAGTVVFKDGKLFKPDGTLYHD
ncbi:CRAL-TRIO domain-containing protein [Coprinopsis sp. MPI-PUGE-AT-0042]|nr:CRAL-TRIO domain-containing protein [Coprinopsis sp. MPI-PUGE-AT-0042]